MATLDAFKAQLDALPEEEREQLLLDLVSAYETEAEAIAAEEDYAEGLRDAPIPGMRDAGRFKVAANPLEFVGAGGQRVMGEIIGHRARKKREAMGQRQTRAMRNLQDLILGSGGGTRGRQVAAANALRAMERRR